MRLWLLAMLCLVCVSCGVTPPAVHPAPADPLESVVSIQIHTASGKPACTTGFVRRDGYVVSPLYLYSLGAADQVVVRTRDGRAHECAGVAGYHPEAGVALLLVEWEGGRPPGLDVALTTAAAGTPLHLIATERQSGAVLDAVEVVAGAPSDKLSVRSVWPVGLNIASTAAGVVVDDSGSVAGVVTSFSAMVILIPSPQLPSASFDYARPEIIAALRPEGEVIDWNTWREVKSGQIDRARDLVPTMRKLNQAGNMEQLVAMAREATELDAACGQAWVYLGWASYNLKQWEEAEAAYFRAESITPTDATSISARSLCLVELGRLRDAERVSARATEVAPNSPEAWAVRGWVLESAEQWDKAAEAYRTQLRLDPKSESAREAIDRLNALEARRNGK